MSEPTSESKGYALTGEAPVMNEGRRQSYLAALGVDLYLARQPLPHAAPSWFPEDYFLEANVFKAHGLEGDFPEGGAARTTDLRSEEPFAYPPDARDFDHAAAPWPDGYGQAGWVSESDAALQARRQEPAVSVAQATRHLVDQSALVKGIPPSPPAVAPKSTPAADLPVPVLRNLKPSSAPSAPVAAPPASLRVGLAVFEWPGKVRVLIELQDPDAPSLSAREHRLWQEIALALWGRDLAYSGQSLPLFRFPPNARLRHLETPEAVREAVESFLQARHSRAPAGMQVMLAGTGLAAAYLGERGASVLQPYLVAVPGGAQTLLLPGLTQMLDHWQLKPAVWHALAAAFRQAGLA